MRTPFARRPPSAATTPTIPRLSTRLSTGQVQSLLELIGVPIGVNWSSNPGSIAGSTLPGSWGIQSRFNFLRWVRRRALCGVFTGFQARDPCNWLRECVCGRSTASRPATAASRRILDGPRRGGGPGRPGRSTASRRVGPFTAARPSRPSRPATAARSTVDPRPPFRFWSRSALDRLDRPAVDRQGRLDPRRVWAGVAGIIAIIPIWRVWLKLSRCAHSGHFGHPADPPPIHRRPGLTTRRRPAGPGRPRPPRRPLTIHGARAVQPF
jgi:hypothetical protein